MSRRVSSKDVAKAAGVSQATVSYVLSNNQNVKIKPETRQLVIETAKKLNYHTNYIARSMRLNKAASIGIVTSKNMSNYLLMNVLEGIKDSLTIRHYTMTLCFERKDDVADSEYIKHFHSKLIDGVIFAFADISDDEKTYLSENNIPYVSIHANIGDDSPFQVKTNLETAMTQAIEHLTGNGCRDIGYIGNSAKNMYAIRYQSYINSMKKQNMPVHNEYVIKTDSRESELEDNIRVKMNALERLPDALFCDTINTGFYMLRYASLNSINIPKELSIVVIGTSPFSQRSCPALSCVEAPLYHMGYCGSDMLLNILEDKLYEIKDALVMDWKFVARESC